MCFLYFFVSHKLGIQVNSLHFNDTFSKPSLFPSIGGLNLCIKFFFYFKCKQAALISVELVLQNALSEVHRMMQDPIAV